MNELIQKWKEYKLYVAPIGIKPISSQLTFEKFITWLEENQDE